MSFLQPWMLWGLPLLALPIIIHLINQWRYQTKKWGAMMFLLAANRMARGYAKLRQLLILLARMAAIAGLLLAASRPLSSGWLGLAGGPPDTTIVVLDRSPSMQERPDAGGLTKLETAKIQLKQTLQSWKSNRWVLIDSVQRKAKEFHSIDALIDSPELTGSDSTANVPELLLEAVEYIRANRPGSTEIWLASDLRQADWNSGSAQWNVLRESVKQFPQSIRFNLLTFENTRTDNIAIRVTDVRRESGLQQQDELVLSMLLTRPEGISDSRTFPIQIEVQGSRSEIEVELKASSLEVKDHRVAIDRNLTRGWGSVSIPADSNLSDNRFYFVFDEPVPRSSAVLAQSDSAGNILSLIASISPDSTAKSEVQRGTLEQFRGLDLDSVGTLIWQGPLPSQNASVEITDFLRRGGRAFFFPPEPEALGNSTLDFMGVKWSGWREFDQAYISTWRGDQDLLATTRSGMALPLNDITVLRAATIEGNVTSLATLSTNDPLFAKVQSNEGLAYFCSTLPGSSYSNLASNGIVLYVALQRAISEGAESLGNTRLIAAGSSFLDGDETSWSRVAGSKESLSTEWSHHQGVFSASEKWLAINRSEIEDQSLEITASQLEELFSGISYARVTSSAGRVAGIVREIWRIFLALMIGALFAEALMCFPKKMTARSPVA